MRSMLWIKQVLYLQDNHSGDNIMKNLEALRLKRHNNSLKDPWIYASGVALVVFIYFLHYGAL